MVMTLYHCGGCGHQWDGIQAPDYNEPCPECNTQAHLEAVTKKMHEMARASLKHANKLARQERTKRGHEVNPRIIEARKNGSNI